IVCDIAPRKYPVGNQDVVDALLKVHPEKLASRKEAEEILAKDLKDKGTIQFLLKNLYHKEMADGSTHLDWRFNLPVISKNLAAMSEATDEPAGSDIETLFINGEKSDYVTKEDETEIRRVFPRAIIKTIAGAGHWVHADKPDEFYDAVMQFCM
ncbi:MAG TPA: alpha/beta hydrolase, partial [Bacteroidia bacterium]|nr:alpha/beta hydrolase [Bacteroidia bacterium]